MLKRIYRTLIQYLAARRAIWVVARSPLFDSNWYLNRYPEARQYNAGLPAHYLQVGSYKGFNPGPEFDNDDYLRANPDVRAAAINPLLHYELSGRAEYRPLYPGQLVTLPLKGSTKKKPMKSRNESAEACDQIELCAQVLASGFWDEAWYLEHYYKEFNDARARSGGRLSVVEYYVTEGWKLGHRPSDRFPMVSQPAAACDPVTWFLDHVRFEGYHCDENLWFPEDEAVADYVAQQPTRRARGVVYTCITSDYDDLMQPYCIDPAWDYICFTDSGVRIDAGRVGVWKICPLQKRDMDPSKLNRWHKFNPHLLFPDHEHSLYIDGNINILTDAVYRRAAQARTPLLLPRHFSRDCVYDEIETLLNSTRISAENKEKLLTQRASYEARRLPRNLGLSENNVIFRRHHEPAVRVIMEELWSVLLEHSPRDQVALPYILWRHGVSLAEITFPNIRVTYSDFAIVKHAAEHHERDQLVVEERLKPAFEGNRHAVVMSCNQSFVGYLGVVLTSIVENASAEWSYDLIVLESDIEDATKKLLIDAFLEHSNVRIRFYNMTSALTQMGDLDLHVDGYVPLETYNKIFLAEITEGYERIAYIDTDIVVNADIAELTAMELWGKALGASPNVANIRAAAIGREIKGCEFSTYLSETLGVDDPNDYFQAGIIVLDMEAPKVKRLYPLALKKLREVDKPIFYDQCIFNSLFNGDVQRFSVAWNHVWYVQDYAYLRHAISERDYFDYARSRLFPKIIHFASKDKPTNKAGWDLSEYFWHYARKSPFGQQILEQATPEVREIDRVSKIDDRMQRTRKPRLLVHLHLFYPEQLEFMMAALTNIDGCDTDLCVTSPHPLSDIAARVKQDFPTARFVSVANQGYDAYPFLKVLYDYNLSHYDYVMKLHTKNARPKERGAVYGLDVQGHRWRDDLVGALLGTREQFISNLKMLESDASVGALGAARYRFTTRENNEEHNYKLAHWRAKYDIDGGEHFIGGNMFLARSYPLDRFTREPLEHLDFSGEAPATGSHRNLAHIFERLFGLVIESEGFTLKGVEVPVACSEVTEDRHTAPEPCGESTLGER